MNAKKESEERELIGCLRGISNIPLPIIVILLIVLSFVLCAVPSYAADYSNDMSYESLDANTSSINSNSLLINSNNPYLVLEKYTYFTNELIDLRIDGLYTLNPDISYSDTLRLELVNIDDDNYRFNFLGELNNHIPYTTNTPGNYTFILYDYSTGIDILLSQVSFQVIDSQSDCVNARVGDEIIIDLGERFGNDMPSYLSIEYNDYSGSKNKIVYGGEMMSQIPYTPSVEGRYDIYADDYNLGCYVVFPNTLNQNKKYISQKNMSEILSGENLDGQVVGGQIDDDLENSYDSDSELEKNVPSDFRYVVSKKEDAVSKEKLRRRLINIGVRMVDEKLFNDNTTEYDIDILDVNSNNSIRITGLKDIDSLGTVKFSKIKNKRISSGLNNDLSSDKLSDKSSDKFSDLLSTDIVYVNDVSIKNATISLEKNSPVTSIARCNIYDPVSGECSSWTVTSIPFEDKGDHIEFTVEHFSAYAGVILITNADLLDENRSIVRNIFVEVQYLDEIWSNIADNHYVRVRFETQLNYSNDITIYARTNDSEAKIYVFEENSSQILAVFDNLTEERYYKTFLYNLTSSQDTFDLLISGGYVEIDHIIDPTPIKVLNVTLLDTYSSAANPCSTDNAQQMARKLDGGFAYIASAADDTLTILNISNSSSISCAGSIADSAPPGSMDGAQGIKLDWERNLAFVCAPTDDAFSIYNITNRNSPSLIGSISTSSTPPQTADGCREVAPIKVGNQYFVAIGAITDDYITIWNVTNPSSPTFLYGYTTGTSVVCSSDDVRAMEWVADRQILIAASYTDDVISIFSVGSDGTLTCLDDYLDNAPPQSIDGPAGFEYDDNTGLLFVAGAVDDTFTILNASNASNIQYVAEVRDVALLNLIDDCTVGDVKGSQSFAYCAILDSTGVNNGIAILNVTDAYNPVLLQNIDETFITDGSGCAFTTTNYVEEHDGILYALSSGDDCFYSIKVYDYYYIDPNMTSARISPSSPTKYTDLLGYCNATDDDLIYYDYIWFLNGAINSTGNTISSYNSNIEINVANISKSLLKLGQNWTLSCRANDTRAMSSWLNSSTVTIVPGASPIINTSRILPTYPNITSTLIGYCNATDAEGDNLTYSYTWYLNGAPYSNGTVHINFTQGIEINIANISSGVLSEGQVWNFSCQAYDGETFSSWKTSEQVIIIELVPPNVSSLLPQVGKLFNISDIIDVAANITDENNIDVAFANITWPNGTYSILTLTLSSDNKYNASFIIPGVLGRYNVSYYANDSWGNINDSESTYFLVQDAIPPSSFSLISPTNGTVSNNLLPILTWQETVEADFNNYTLLISEDDSFTTIDYSYYTFQITNTTYQLTIPLQANTIYYWRVIAYDNTGNLRISEEDNTYITDTSIPSVILNAPAEGTKFNYSLIMFNYTPSDMHLLNCSLYGNFTGSWTEDQHNITPINNQPNYFSKTLSDGNYLWNIRCFDSAGQQGFATNNFTLQIDTQAPGYYNTSETPNSPAIYSASEGYTFNITWMDNFAVDTVLIEHNFTGVSSNYTVSGIGGLYSYTQSGMAAGSYYYKWYANDTLNNKNNTDPYYYIVEKANSTITLAFNGSSSNITINQNDIINITVTLINPDYGNVSLFKDGELLVDSPSPIEYILEFDTYGLFNITASYAGDENYSMGAVTYYVNVTDIAAPIITQLFPSNNSIVGSNSVNFLYIVNDANNISNCSLYIDGSINITNNTVARGTTQYFYATLSDGNYSYRISCYDIYGNFADGLDYNFSVIKTSGINITVNSTELLYEIGANVNIGILTTDIFGGPIQATALLAVVNYTNSSGAQTGWWNSSWKKRVALNITSNSGLDLYDIGVTVNVTGLSGNIASCSELRIIDYKESEGGLDNNLFIISGDNSNWCNIRFNTNLTAYESNTTRFFAYYNNTGSGGTVSPYSTNYSTVTCVDVWGFDCGTGPPEVGGDNTFDTCANGLGNDESVESMSVNSTRIVYGQTINVTCVYDPYTSGDDTYIWYYNGTGWRKLFEHLNWGSSSTAYSESVVFTPDNVEGVHWVRCGITYSTDANGDQCMDSGSYYDNDDVNFTVTGIVAPSSTSTTALRQELLANSINITDSSGLSSWDWYTGELGSGNYSIIGIAKKATYADDSNYVKIELIPDNTPPKIYINAPPNGLITNISNITLNWTINDTQSNVTCNLTINGVVNQSNILSFKNVPKLINLTNISEGTYYWNVTCIDRFGNKNTSETTTYTYALPPSPFNLLTPLNNTESSILIPTFTWEQTIEQNFNNYTLLLDKDPSFASPDYSYNTLQITNTSLTLNFALDANSVYFWRVIAYDLSGNSRNSTQVYSYITDTLAPSVILNNPANNSFNSPDVFFNYTPSELNTLVNCSLYGNFTGVWMENKSQTTVFNLQENNFTQTLGHGKYLWNVMCVDLAGNKGFAPSNNTVIVDLIGPNIQLFLPQNNTYVNTTNIINFTARSIDVLGNTSQCKLIINNVTRQTKTNITDGVNFTFIEFVQNGNYSWSVNCTDLSGNERSSVNYNLSVYSIDADPPVILLNNPGDGAVFNDENLTFNYTPQDSTGIENCSIFIDDVLISNNFTINNLVPNYFSIQNISEAVHNWTIWCYDNSTEYNLGKSQTRIFTIDLTNPSVTLHHPIDNSFINSPQVRFNYTPSDTTLSSCVLYGNFSGSWAADLSNSSVINNQINSFLRTLSDGTYSWNIFCNDSSGSSSFAASNWTIKVDTTAPYYSGISEYPQSPSAYSQSVQRRFNITWSDNFAVDTVIIEHNFTGIISNYTVSGTGGIYSYSAPNIASGTYYYKWYANDSVNNIANTSSFTYVVTKSGSTPNLLLNGSSDNLTIDEDNIVNITAAMIDPENGFVEIMINSQLINNGTAPLENLSFFSEPGVYAITMNYLESENYTSSSQTLYLYVNDLTPPVINQTFPGNNSFVGSSTVNFLYIVSDSSDIENCSIYINDSLNKTDQTITRDISQSFQVTLPDGNYTWRVECFDSYGNNGIGENYNFTLIKSDTIFLNLSTQNLTYERGSDIQVNISMKDVFDAPLQAYVDSVILNYSSNPGAHTGWWNVSWNRRMALNVTALTGTDKEGIAVDANITGLDGFISNCSEIRIVDYKYSDGGSNIGYILLDGDDSNWCYIKFVANLTAYESNVTRFFVYYNNSGASSESSPFDTDYSTRTCVDVWGFDCGTGPPEVGGDNTFDTCANGLGNDESVESMSVNSTRIVYGQTINVTCVYDPYTSADYTYIWYYNGTGWRKLFEHLNWGSSSTAYSESVVFTPDNVEGVHWVRCGIIYQQPGDTDECMDSGSYYDNDDVNFTVTGILGNTSVNVTETKQNILLSYSNYTDIFGKSSFNWKTSNYSYGNYSIISVGRKANFLDASTFKVLEIIPDTTPPAVTLKLPLDLEQRGVGLVDFIFSTYDINIKNCTLYTDLSGAFSANETISSVENYINYTFEDKYASIGLYYWNVLCYDSYGNAAFASYNFTLNITGPDMTVYSNEIWFSDAQRIEGSNITVFANITNAGLSANNESFIVQFYLGNPFIDGVQIEGDKTIGILNPSEVVTINASFLLTPGINAIFLLIDSIDTLNESNEANNLLNNSIFVALYQYYYGNVTADIILASQNSTSIISFGNTTTYDGYLFISDQDCVFSFNDLQSIGRTKNDLPTSDDFSEIDDIFNTSSFIDSVNLVWTNNTNVPLEIAQLNMSSKIINNVPVVNTTNSSYFRTGILWDASDDYSLNDQYDSSDKEDLVFVTQVKNPIQGEFGIYSYEIKVPAKLREYKGTNDKVDFYYELK